MFKIATWNVNSLKVRLPQVLEWLAAYQPDVLALQEIKIPNELFPSMEFEAIGYNTAYSGQKTYNGVAVISKDKPVDIVTDFPAFDDPQRRVLATTIGDVRVINVYVPNGQSLDSDKYQYKLTWFARLNRYVEEQLKSYKKLIVLGDFNIAPSDLDIYDPKAWEGHVLVSDKERAALQGLLNLGLSDAHRLLDKKTPGYSWWDYRMAGFRRNLGIRLDLLLISDVLAETLQYCEVDKEPRKAERPSDHTPVVAVFD